MYSGDEDYSDDITSGLTDAAYDRYANGWIGTRTTRICTEHVCPPIPTRDFDWAAWWDGREDGPVGRGATEQEAIAELRAMEEES